MTSVTNLIENIISENQGEITDLGSDIGILFL